jgi:hypothetical protein
MKQTKISGYVLLGILLLIPLLIPTNPVDASDGQYIDQILLFEPPTTTHSFNLTLEKNQKYEFACQVYTPGVEVDIALRLIGPDGDGDGFEDEFYVGSDRIGPSDGMVSALFGCAISGDYLFSIIGLGGYKLSAGFNPDPTENVNVHLAMYERGSSYSGNSILMDTSGYYNTKTRTYYADLQDDTEYTIIASRVNSIPGNQTVFNRIFPGHIGEYLEAFISITMYDEENHDFELIENVKLENVYGLDQATASFGVSLKGEYRFEIDISSTIDTINIMFIIKEGSNIGDGPEDNPTDPDDNSTSISDYRLTITVPKWTFGVVFGVGMIFVLIAVAVSRERNMRNIIR